MRVKIKHYKRMILPLLLFSAFFCQPAYAATYQTEVVNNISIGDIRISLNEYELSNGVEVPYKNNKIVVPGQQISKIVRITNEANTSWIRVKIEYTSEDGINGLSDDMINISNTNWIKRGAYYYYKTPVKQDEEIEFIDSIRIPVEWDETYANKQFSIVITAEAVQEANFTPDFNTEDPWFGTIIETCTHTEYSTENITKQNFEVAFENGAKGLVRIGDDFFNNFGSLMPGDTVSDTVTLKNNYTRPITLYFRTETIADDNLLKQIHLEIKNSNKIIYSGTLDGAITNKIQIAYLQKGASDTLTYTLSVPLELTNEYGLSSTKTKWIFTADVRSSSSGGSTGGSSGGGGGSNRGGTQDPNHGPGVIDINNQNQPDNPNNPSDNPNNPSDNTNNPDDNQNIAIIDTIKDIPKMGDNNASAIALAIAVTSGGLALLLLLISRRRKDDEEHDE